ncbi:MAG: DHHA1 domain-containing protein, partial [Candidatus Altiarchaeota archaeon]|nr:DHHA1 domain-containing protein [Candidatus Altiarchaeota archaeon]
RDDAENEYGFRLYQGGVVPGGDIRVVNIRDWDVEACGGMHLNNTGDVGAIRITGSKRIQDGVVRLEYVAGNAALEYGNEEKKLYEKICESINESMKPTLDKEEVANAAAILSVQIEKLPETFKRFLKECKEMEEEIMGLGGSVEKPIKDQKVVGIENTVRQVFNLWKKYRKTLENLKKTRGDVLREGLKEMFGKDYVVVDNVRIVKKITRNLDMKTLTEAAKDSVTKKNHLLILLNTAGDKVNVIVASNSRFHAGKLAKNLSQKLGGGAHGDNRLGMGGGLLRDAEKILKGFKP